MKLRLARLGLGISLATLAIAAFGQVTTTNTTQVLQPSARGTIQLSGTFDTRIGNQISDHSGLPEMWRPENPLIYPNYYSPLPPSRIRLGSTMKESRASVQSLFPGISMDQWSPPDPTIAVGPNHVVATVNMKIAFYLKDGTLQYLKWLGNQEAGGFMAGIGALNFTFDPKCYYDAASGRFFVVVPEYYTNPNRSWMNIAVSDDSDPNGVWYFYRASSIVTQGGSQYWVDYPGFGVDQNGIYVTGNLFGFSSGFLGGWWRCYQKAPMLNGQSTTFVDFVDTGASSIQAAQATGTPQSAYFVSVHNSSTLRVHAVRDLLTSPTKVSMLLSVPAFVNPSQGAPQQGTSSRIDTLDGRLMNVWWRDGKLITAHAVRPNSGTTRTVGRWYEMDTNNWPASGSVTLAQSGNVDDGTRWMVFPVVAFNDFNDMGVIVGGSSASQFAGIYVSGRKKVDPPGATGALTQAQIGSAGYTGGRWGDYFGIQVDPADGLTFWGVGEYADGSGSWRTWITSWRVATYRQLHVFAKGGPISPFQVQIDCTTDGRGLGGGVGEFYRTYYDAQNVTLTAQTERVEGGYRWIFVAWYVNNVEFVGPTTIQFPMNSDTQAIAYYKGIPLEP